MANPSVTYTFANSTTADATQVNQNFSDLINSLTDGTKDLSISALTAAGTATLNGSINLGNASGDDLTITASLASTLSIKTNNSFNIGSATLGLAGLYLGAAGGFTTKLAAAATSSWTLTLPVTAGTNRYVLSTNGSGATTWDSPQFSPRTSSNYGIAASVGSNALTLSLKGADGNNPSATNQIDISFRNATVATGTPVTRTVSSALSVVVSNGSTLGHASAVNQYLWLYAIDNAGTVELAVSGSPFVDELSVVSTTSEGGGGAADSNTVLYSTTTRSNVAVRLLGRLKSNQTVAGTWATSIAEISLAAGLKDPSPRSQVFLQNGNGHGSTNTKIRRFTNAIENYGTAITYADSVTLGASFTINEPGLYAISYQDARGGGATDMGVSNNSSELTTNVGSISGTNHIVHVTTAGSGFEGLACPLLPLNTGDVVRPHTDGGPDSTNADDSNFRIVQVVRFA